jgi:hypothetical protein
MAYDYTDPLRDDLIPHNTIATLVLHIRPGGVGEEGMLRPSAKGDCEMLDCKLTIRDGPYEGRTFWESFCLNGTRPVHAKAADISRSKLKAILDSALGLKPDDASPQAREKRTVSLKQFDGMSFVGRIGIEKGRLKNDGSGENWPDKNILAGVITPDKKDWHPVEQPPPFNGGGGGAQAAPPNPALPISRPTWAL